MIPSYICITLYCQKLTFRWQWFISSLDCLLPLILKILSFSMPSTAQLTTLPPSSLSIALSSSRIAINSTIQCMKKEQYSSCYLTANNNPISSRMLSIIMTVHVSSHRFHNHQQREERNHHLVDQVILPREIVVRREIEKKAKYPLLNIDDGATRSKPTSKQRQSQRRRHRLLGRHEHHVDEEEQQKHKHTLPTSLSPCQESYKLYKICSTRYDKPTGFDCSSSLQLI